MRKLAVGEVVDVSTGADFRIRTDTNRYLF
jgi:hypothetical protein